uniref:Uncharacterized protein n=1 Tax=Musa acuminata subsp. malaccensis TaxID=214687 RepID=A0A804IWZ6_MUSAM
MVVEASLFFLLTSLPPGVSVRRNGS